MTKLLAELETSDKQYETLHTSMMAATARCSKQRQVIENLTAWYWLHQLHWRT